MIKLKLLNTSEYLTEQVLRQALAGTNFRVFAQLPLRKVIQREKGEELSKRDRAFLDSSELDFVVYNEDSFPQLAIEFDGPAHETYEDQKTSDIRKNRLCQQAGLPLLRIGDIHLEEHDKTTLLEYILLRFVAWMDEKDEILAEVNEYIATLTTERLKELTEGGFLDPEIDPTFLFDLRHPFPATAQLASQLYSDFGIVSPHLDMGSWHQARDGSQILELTYNGGRQSYQDHCFEESRLYVLSERIQRSNGQIGRSQIWEVQVSFHAQWTSPVVNDYDESETQLQYYLRTDTFPVVYQDIPGISMPELVENFCDYLALKKAERWARAGGLSPK